MATDEKALRAATDRGIPFFLQIHNHIISAQSHGVIYNYCEVAGKDNYYSKWVVNNLHRDVVAKGVFSAGFKTFLRQFMKPKYR